MCTHPGWLAVITCPDCGHPLTEVNQTRPTNREATAVAQCGNCHHEFAITVHLVGLTCPATADAAARQRRHRGRSAA